MEENYEIRAQCIYIVYIKVGPYNIIGRGNDGEEESNENGKVLLIFLKEYWDPHGPFLNNQRSFPPLHSTVKCLFSRCSERAPLCVCDPIFFFPNLTNRKETKQAISTLTHPYAGPPINHIPKCHGDHVIIPWKGIHVILYPTFWSETTANVSRQGEDAHGNRGPSALTRCL